MSEVVSVDEKMRRILPKRISAKTFALAGVLSFLIIQLNIFFAWTSHVGASAGPRGFFPSSGGPLRSFLVSEVDDFVRFQFGMPGISSFFTNLASKGAYNGGGFLGGGNFGGGGHAGGAGGGFLFLGSSPSLAMKYFIDAEVIVFTSAVFVVSLLLFQKSGIRIALLRAFEITSMSVLPLGLEIFSFDRFEFDVHASDIQVLAGAAWLTNADVLVLSSAILAVALLVEVRRYVSRKNDSRVLIGRVLGDSA